MVFDPEGATAATAGIFGLDVAAVDAGLVLVPVPFDATASYGRRARFGPEAILRASHQVDLFDLETGKPYEVGIAMVPPNPSVERWNAEASRAVDTARSTEGLERASACAEANRVCELVNRWLFEETRAWLARGKMVGLIGGDHATAYGCIHAHAERYPGMGILHIDAHADLRNTYEGFAWSHASIMHNVMARLPVQKLVQVGLRDVAASEIEQARQSSSRIEAFTDYAIASHRFSGQPFRDLIARIVDTLPDDVYVSFDIDGLDPALCPTRARPSPAACRFTKPTPFSLPCAHRAVVSSASTSSRSPARLTSQTSGMATSEHACSTSFAGMPSLGRPGVTCGASDALVLKSGRLLSNVFRE